MKIIYTKIFDDDQANTSNTISIFAQLSSLNWRYNNSDYFKSVSFVSNSLLISN